jgi:signal peptidase I
MAGFDSSLVVDSGMANKAKRILLGRNPGKTLIRAGVLIALSFLIFRFVLVPLRLEGGSMEPTYMSGQVSLANRLAYLAKPPERGDVVAVRMRSGGRSFFLLKRIVGLPGESIGFAGGKLTVDGKQIDEQYLAYESEWNREPVLCEEDEYFVVGDNRSMSIEQHTLGRTTRSRIVGKVVF